MMQSIGVCKLTSMTRLLRLESNGILCSGNATFQYHHNDIESLGPRTMDTKDYIILI